MIRPRRRASQPRRRSGPAGEEPWWDPGDQARVEQPMLTRSDLGRGWAAVPMLNNVEQLDPFGDDEASELVRAARDRRRVTALDEGSAWRRRTDGALVVVRMEAFANAGEQEAAHRAVWRAEGPQCLEAVFRQRWQERDRAPGWIEALWKSAVDPSITVPEWMDWIRVEDQTGSAETVSVTAYEHLTVWAGRFHAIVIVRHDVVDPADDVALRAASAIARGCGVSGA